MSWQLIIYILAGGLSGFLSGLLGIGGGIIFVFVIGATISLNPTYNFADESYASTVIFNSVFCILFTSFSGCYKLYRRKEFDFISILNAALPAALSSLLMTLLLNYIVYSKKSFLIIFSIALIPIFLKFFKQQVPQQPSEKKLDRYKFSISGLFSGVGSALTGLGGGFLFNPILHGYFGYPIKKTFAISIGVIFLSSISIVSSYSILNILDQSNGQPIVLIPEIVVPLILGAIIMAPFGIVVAQKLRDVYLRTLFLIFAIIVLVKNLIEIIK